LRSQQESSTVVYTDNEWTPKVHTATAYLESLNPEERRAVEHGAAGGFGGATVVGHPPERAPERPTPSPIGSLI
jgi:DNA helicase-2/ATP-dependent DNA helicase PcrA